MICPKCQFDQICPKCQFDQPDSKNCVRCGVIFAKYPAYLDRLEQDTIAAQSNENNIEIEEKNPAEKIRVLFPFLTQPWKSVSTPAFIFLSLLFLLHGIFLSKRSDGSSLRPALVLWQFY